MDCFCLKSSFNKNKNIQRPSDFFTKLAIQTLQNSKTHPKTSVASPTDAVIKRNKTLLLLKEKNTLT